MYDEVLYSLRINGKRHSHSNPWFVMHGADTYTVIMGGADDSGS
ncbi:hypothetical protein [Vulcanisaeta souniana]|uniref:Uncharacterized protein n=1 Tax=Vulcanisaeta souniana JCM 11219 TaxID=1293586 RepID=A0ABM8BNL0_9CREN|nr:hypothetical protein [Vulcanisaeta souniana]BDR92527.1 hypothetical protein Vsou_16200 [Vulcanisaeta souniana JCM 11219]